MKRKIEMEPCYTEEMIERDKEILETFYASISNKFEYFRYHNKNMTKMQTRYLDDLENQVETLKDLYRNLVLVKCPGCPATYMPKPE